MHVGLACCDLSRRLRSLVESMGTAVRCTGARCRTSTCGVSTFENTPMCSMHAYHQSLHSSNCKASGGVNSSCPSRSQVLLREACSTRQAKGHRIIYTMQVPKSVRKKQRKCSAVSPTTACACTWSTMCGDTKSDNIKSASGPVLRRQTEHQRRNSTDNGSKAVKGGTIRGIPAAPSLACVRSWPLPSAHGVLPHTHSQPAQGMQVAAMQGQAMHGKGVPPGFTKARLRSVRLRETCLLRSRVPAGARVLARACRHARLVHFFLVGHHCQGSPSCHQPNAMTSACR